MKKQKAFLLNLTQDIVFKNYFKAHKSALKSLLKAFLPLPDNTSIKEIEILDPIIPNLSEKEKTSVMDLRLSLKNGEQVNVEMQTCSHPGFKERVLFYWAKNYGSQLTKGKQYKSLCPVYSLIFTTFKLFPATSRYYNVFSIRSEDPPHFYFNRDLCFVTVELSKFKKQEVKALLDFKEKWCYILKESGRMGEKEYKAFIAKSPEMEEDMVRFRRLSKEESYQMWEEAKEKARLIQASRENQAFEQGMEKGMSAGMEKGMSAGMENVAINMLKNKFKLSVISEMTGLSTEEIKNLKNASN